MSHLAKLKVKLHYEKDVPRCATCRHFKSSRIVMTTHSQTRVQKPLCGLHGFITGPANVCDTWVSHKGETLEPIEQPKIEQPKKGKTK
jgi:hypothetical protein